MSTIIVTAIDVKRINVILSALKKGHWELEGEEVLAFAQAFGWVAELHEKITMALHPVSKIEPGIVLEVPKLKVRKPKK